MNKAHGSSLNIIEKNFDTPQRDQLDELQKAYKFMQKSSQQMARAQSANAYGKKPYRDCHSHSRKQINLDGKSRHTVFKQYHQRNTSTEALSPSHLRINSASLNGIRIT